MKILVTQQDVETIRKNVSSALSHCGPFLTQRIIAPCPVSSFFGLAIQPSFLVRSMCLEKWCGELVCLDESYQTKQK